MSIGAQFKSWVREQKDASMSFVLESSLRKFLGQYGEVLNFQIDSKQRTAVLDLHPKGDKEAIRLTIDEYEVVQNPTGTFLCIKRASASREWVHLLCQQYLLGHLVKVPEKYANWAKMLL